MTIHELKSWPESFKAIKKGKKTCDLRLNDRSFQVGDIVLFREFDPEAQPNVGGAYLGDKTVRIITHIQLGGLFGLGHGHVCLSFKRVK